MGSEEQKMVESPVPNEEMLGRSGYLGLNSSLRDEMHYLVDSFLENDGECDLSREGQADRGIITRNLE